MGNARFFMLQSSIQRCRKIGTGHERCALEREMVEEGASEEG